jgi:hypothetical protein
MGFVADDAILANKSRDSPGFCPAEIHNRPPCLWSIATTSVGDADSNHNRLSASVDFTGAGNFMVPNIYGLLHWCADAEQSRSVES